MMSLGMNNLSSLSSSYTFSRYRAMEPFHDSCIMGYDEIVQEGGAGRGGECDFCDFRENFPKYFYFLLALLYYDMNCINQPTRHHRRYNIL